MPKPFSTLPLAALALVSVSAAAQAQNYSDLPPLAPMAQNQLRDLPADMRSAPVPVSAPMQMDETVTTVNGVETITRTRRIEGPRPAPRWVCPIRPIRRATCPPTPQRCSNATSG